MLFNSFEELSVKASQLKLCFYCHSALPASQKEHIFNACWGPERIDQYFNDEISKLAGFDYPLDANDAELRKTLDSLKNKSAKVDEKILEQYRQAFLTYFMNRGKILNKSINSDKVLSKMSDYGLTVSSAHNFTDKKCCDADFQSFVTKVFANLTTEFVQDSLS